jgi:hypothetical protein
VDIQSFKVEANEIAATAEALASCSNFKPHVACGTNITKHTHSNALYVKNCTDLLKTRPTRLSVLAFNETRGLLAKIFCGKCSRRSKNIL